MHFYILNILIGIIITNFIALFLKKKNKAKIYLLTLYAFSLLTILETLGIPQLFKQIILFDFDVFPIKFSYMALLHSYFYYYFKKDEVKNTKHNLLIYIPWAIEICIFCAIVIYSYTITNDIQLATLNKLFSQYGTITDWLAIIYDLILFTYISIETRTYLKKLKRLDYSLDRKQISWVNGLLILVPISLSMCTLYFYLTSSNIIKRSDIFFVDITIAGTLFILGYWQLITPEVADELKIVNNDIQQIDANEITQNETIEQSQKSTITYSELFIKINKYIASQSAYLNPDLGIAEISEYIGENITNISKCIRTETKDNFYQYINSYRVYHMIELMNISENHQYTLDYIANTSGIKSRTTLSKYFNAICEMSPSSLRNKIIKKEVDTNVFLSSLIERYKYLSILLQEADNKQLISEQQTKSVSI